MLLITTMIQIIMLMIFHRTSRFPLLAVYWVSSWGSLLSRSKQKPSTPSSSSSLTPPFRWLSSYTTAWASPGRSVQVSLSLSSTQGGGWPRLPTCLPTSGLHTWWAILWWAIRSTWVLSKKKYHFSDPSVWRLPQIYLVFLSSRPSSTSWCSRWKKRPKEGCKC